jgi:YHS domain-containing protein
MKVDSESRHSVEHAGELYYFCSQHCLEKFQANPTQYLKPVVAAAVQAAGIYTCPMHPEVRQATPGSCPKCGMALEPVNPVPARPDVTGQGAYCGPRGYNWILVAFLAIAAFFLLSEHSAHLLGALPFLLLLACPLMHLFMHHGHGAHGKHGEHTERSEK